MVAEVAQGHQFLAMAEEGTLPLEVDIMAAEVVAVITAAEAVVVIPVVEGEATPAADIVDVTRTRSAS
jgi:hypothetical protein